MTEPLRIELPSKALAIGLCRQLRQFEPESATVDGHSEVRIELDDANAEQRVSDVLRSIDAWLAATGVASVQVDLDGRSITLHAPRARA